MRVGIDPLARTFATPQEAIAAGQALHRRSDARFAPLVGMTVRAVSWGDDVLRLDLDAKSLLVTAMPAHLQVEVLDPHEGPRPVPHPDGAMRFISERLEFTWQQDSIAWLLLGQRITRLLDLDGQRLYIYRRKQLSVMVGVWNRLDAGPSDPRRVLHWDEAD